MNAFSDVVKNATKKAGEIISNSVEGKTATGFSKAINVIGRNSLGVPEVMYRTLAQKQGFKKALNETFRHADGKLNYGKIAGSYLGVTATGRVLSGGGIYKDGQGNTNLIGVPFV